MRFSIIIPVYNVEKYIRKCMESVMNQTFRDYEVIVVDDESPDNSMRIVEEFAEAYPGMITMIHQKNTRQGGARNRGVREAKGEYLIFVDSDDYVRLDMLEFVDRKLREEACDIFVFQYKIVTTEGAYQGVAGGGGLLPGSYLPAKDKQVLFLPANPANKAFNREFYINSGVEYPEKLLYEDAVLRLLYAKASKIVVSDEVLYYYVQSSNSSIRQKPSKKMLDILTMSDLVIDRFRREALYDFFREHLECSLIGGIVYILDVINDADCNSSLQDDLIDFVLSRFPDHLQNPYLDEKTRRYLKLLAKRKYKEYHIRVILPRRLRKWLLQWTVIEKLNQLRKSLRRQQG